MVCLFDTAESAQFILNRLARAVIPFGMCFASSKFKVMYENWDSPEPPLTLNGVRLDVVDRFSYLGSYLSKGGSIGSEINARISKAPNWPSQTYYSCKRSREQRWGSFRFVVRVRNMATSSTRYAPSRSVWSSLLTKLGQVQIEWHSK